MKIKNVKGIVISQVPYKESSKVINIFTEDGIIGCMSKGCKSVKSPLRLLSERFAYGNFQLSYKESGLSTLIDGDIIDHFENIKNDILSVSYLTYICDLSSKVYKECENKDVYNLMINAINKIEEGFNPKVITNILELQYLPYIGIKLNLDECVICGSKKVVTLSLDRGGYVCASCRRNEILLNEKVMKLLRLYSYVDISKITSLDIDNEVIDRKSVV